MVATNKEVYNYINTQDTSIINLIKKQNSELDTKLSTIDNNINNKLDS